MPLLVLSLTGSPAQAGLVGVTRTIAFPLVSLPSGVIADRVDRRGLMIVCALGRLVAIGSIPVAFVVGRPSLVQLLLVTLLDAGLFATAQVAERGLLGEIVAPDAYADAVALNEGRAAVASTAGPPLGGALFAIGRSLPFVADSASFLTAFLSLLGMRVPARDRSRASSRGSAGDGVSATRRVIREAREGGRWLWGQPFLRAGSLLYAAANLTLAAVELLGLLIARRHGASSAAIGGAFAILGVGGVLGAAIAGPLRRRLSTRWGVLAEIWFDALLVPLLLIAHSPLAIGVVLGVMVLPMTISSSIVVGARLVLTPAQLRGRVQASAGFIAGSIAWTGPLAIGLLFQYAGESATVLSLSGWSLAVAGLATASRGLRVVPDLSAAADDA